MCGIAGFTHRSFRPDPSRIRRAAASLVHRGPDGQAVFETAHVSLAAARLKIIDLALGDQPMTAPDGDTTIVFNGEIYNHLELRRELEALGHRFHSRADTETVLNAFIQWDTECFSRLRGMFAVALWQQSAWRLVLARDRVGIKPLYIAERGQEIYFGSELKTIFLHPEIERRLDPQALDCYLSLNYVPAPATLVEGVEKLLPGQWLEWKDGKTRRQCYWRLPSPATAPSDFGIKESTEALDELLNDSVREHLLSDVPVGVWLSGGIDSSTILHYASKLAGRQIKTFSISFHGRTFDESAYIHQLVDEYGTDHEELDLNPSLDLAGATEEFAHYADEPNADAGALPVWFLSRMTRRGATVALSGEGADELFGGYLTYRADSLARFLRPFPDAALRLGVAALGALPVSDEKISLEYKLKRFIDGCRMDPARAHVYWNGTFSDDEKRQIVMDPPTGGLARILEGLDAAGESLPAYLWFDQKYYLPDDILSKVDRMSMAHSVEVRPPFLDHRIVEFAASVPSRYKIRGTSQKILLRRLMAGRLPRPILRRSKVGFDIPAHEWLRGPLRPLLEDTLDSAASEWPELFDWTRIQSYRNDHFSRRSNYGYHLWGLMILCLWMRRWEIQVGPALDAPAHAHVPVKVAIQR